MSGKLTLAQRRLLEAAARHMFGRVAGGDTRTRELLVGYGFIECDGVLHGGLLYKITAAGRQAIAHKPQKLTPIQLDMLYRVALAEQSLDSPVDPAPYDRQRAVKALEKLGLVKFDLHWRVTPDGEAAITELLDDARADVLRQSRDRYRALHTVSTPNASKKAP